MCTTTGEGGANTCKQGMGLCVHRQRRGELIHVSKVWDCVYTGRGGGGASNQGVQYIMNVPAWYVSVT